MGAGGSKEGENVDISVLSEIPDDIRGRIEKHFREQNGVIEELRTKHEKLRVNSGQRYFELEKELIETQGDLNLQTGLASTLKEQVADLENKYGEASQQQRQLQHQEFEHGKQKDELCRAKLTLESEKRDLSDIVDKKNKEIDRLQDEWKQMSLKINEASREKIAAIGKKDETLSDFVKVEHQVNRLKQEKDMLNQQVVWLEAQLKDKSSDLLNIRKDTSSRVLELQSELDIKVGELQHTHDQLQHAKDTNEKLVESNDKYINKLEDLTNVQTFREEQFRTQLLTQEKLIDLYKKSSGDAEERCKQFETGAEEVQALLTDALKAKEEIEELRRDDSVRFDSIVQNKEKVITKLETELTNANELLEAAKKKGMVALSEEHVHALSPAAAAASKLLKSGMSLTQIYSEYVQASEKLVFEEAENKRLTECLETIMAEIEQKAPMLQQQREAYERGLQTIDLLTSQLDTAVTEADRRQIQMDETNRQFGQVSRENYRLKQQCVDMGTQVRMLLKELEQARGAVVTHTDDVSMQAESSAQGVISQKLVTFRSIEELQEQNQKLLGVVRDLSEQQERDEQSTVDAKTAQLNKRLEAAMGEMEEMRASRERQVQLTEAIVRQRDMYKALLSESHDEMQFSSPVAENQSSRPSSRMQTPRVGAPTTPKSATKSPSVDKSLLDESKAALKELQAEFKTYRREKGENETMLSEQVDVMREQLSEQRVNNAKLTTQLSYAEERYKTVHSNIEKYKLEIHALTDKNSRYSGSVGKHEQTIAMLREDLMGNQEKLTRAEVHVERLQQQCDMLRTMEARLSQEKESVLREQRSENLLLANIQAIQNNLERSEFETKTMLNNRIEQLEKENVLVKRKLDQAQDHQRSHIQSLERQLTEAREMLGQEDTSHRRTANELRRYKEQCQQFEIQVAKVESQLVAARVKASESDQPQHMISTQAAVSAEQLRECRLQLTQCNTHVSDLEEQLQNSRRHAEQYKAIADTMETNLAASTQASKELQDKLEQQVTEAQHSLAEAQSQFSGYEEEKQRLLSENIQLNAQIKSSNSDLRAEVERLDADLQESVQRCDGAVLNEQKALTDLHEHVQRADEAQDKYQRELMLHAADVTSLTHVKEELEGFTVKLNSAEESAREANDRLALEKVSWTEQKKLSADDRSRLQARLAELQQQNELLHDNLDQLSKQMLGIQDRKVEEDRDTAQLLERVAKQPQDKSAQQLLEVIKFLRKEKDIAETRLEVVQAESVRYKHQAQSLDKQLHEATQAVESEREKAQVTVQTAAQHADLLSKVETLNILQESNRMMREEKHALCRQVSELEANVKQLECDMQPVQQSNRELATVKDTLTVECHTLRGEIERWKARTNRLIEERIDPHEHKQVVDDLAATRLDLAAKTEDSMKTKAELSQVNKQLADSKAEATTASTKVNSLSEEIEKIKAEAQTKDKDLEDKNKMLNQLRNIGRKYRKQAEDTQRDMDTLKKQQEQTLKINVPEMQEQVKLAEEKLKLTEEQLKTSDESLKSVQSTCKAKDERLAALETERNEVLGKLGASETEKTDLLKNMLELETRAQQSTEQHNKLTEELRLSKVCETKLKTEKDRVDAQLDHHRKLVLGARSKISTQRIEIEKLSKETGELSAKVAGVSQDETDERVNALKSQYDNQITRLRKDLETTRVTQQETQTAHDKIRHDLQSANKKNIELVQRINHLQKLVEVYRSQISVTSSAQKPTVSSAPTESPKTANIRPMTAVSAPTSTTQVRMQQPQPIQPVRSATSETRAMASIRPMAVSTQAVTMSTATSQSQTPTATVHPTTQESEATQPLHVSTQPSTSSGRPTQPVQAVSPHVDGSREQPSVSDESSSPSNQEPTSTSPSMSVTPSTSVSSSTPTTQPPTREVAPCTSLGGAASTSGLFGTKRPRDDEEDQTSPQTEQEQVPVKKTKMAVASPAGEVSQSEGQVEGSTAPPVAGTNQEQEADSEPQDAEATADHSLHCVEAEDCTVAPSDMSSQAAETSSQEDVIIVEESDGMQDEDMVEGMEGGDQYEVYEDESTLEMQADVIIDDDDDVVIVEDDDGDVHPSTQPVSLPPPQQVPSHSNQQLEAQSSSSTVASQLSSSSSAESARLAPAGGFGRGMSSGARSQLQPFLFGGESGQMDLGDDGIVPSTPTLFVPKRSDGFAEAVSSPQVSREFIFGGGGGGGADASQPDFGQLASHGGLDNPFIDLAQLERDGHQQSTQSSVTSSVLGTQQGMMPVIAITEVVEQEAASGATSAEAGSLETLTQQQVVGSTSSTENSSQQASSSDEQTTGGQQAGQYLDLEEQGQGEGSQTTGEASARPIDETTNPQDKSDSSDSQKPKIQPIVWGAPSTSGMPPSQPQRQPASTQRPQPNPPQQQLFPQTAQPITAVGSQQYQQQQEQLKRFPAHAARRGGVGFRGRQTAFRSRRPSGGRGQMAGQMHGHGAPMPQPGMPRGMRGRGSAKRGPFRQQPF